MAETGPGAAPTPPGGRAAWRRAAVLLGALALSGCAIPFGASDGDTSRPSLREQNSLYLQEQELRARERQQPGAGGPPVPDR